MVAGMPPAFGRAIAAFLLLGLCLPLRAAEEPAPGFAESTDPESAPAQGRKAKKPTATAPVSKDLVIATWSGRLPVPEPVGISVAPDGAVYVTQTERRKVGDLDIRDHKDWIPQDVALESIEAKAAFFHDILAPGKNGPVPDNNKDNSRDWRDLTVPTERLWRYRDTKGTGTADERIEFASGFNTEVTGIAAGILFHQGSVYATIAPDFWKLTDTNADGKADQRQSLFHGFGLHIAYAGHDMHGPRVGPDGRIYWTIGDKGVHVSSKEGRLYHFPHRGCLMRCDPDGSNFEVVLTGLRNTQEIVFDEFGNMFGEDNDADKPGERERVLFLIEGADYGWQNGYQYRGKDYDPWMAEAISGPRTAGQPAYVLPAICFGHDGPGALAYNAGTALGAKWARTFFVGQFTGSGRINAYQLEPDGAGFKQVNDRVVCEGVAAVSFAWGPDGRLYSADWEGGYDMNHVGFIRTLDVPAAEADPRRTETQALLKAGAQGKNPAERVALLAHPDMRVRLDAQFALVAQKATDLLAKTATDAKADRFARIHSLWGLGQAARLGKAPLALPDKAIAALIADADPEIRAQTAKICGDSACAGAGALVAGLLKDPVPRVRLFAGIAMGKMGQGGHVWPGHEPAGTDPAPLVQFLAENNDKDVYLRQAGVFALAQTVSAGALEALADHPSAAVRRAAVLALRRQDSPKVSSFFADQDPSVANEAVLAYHDRNFSDPKPFDGEPLAALLDKPAAALKLPVSAQRRIINANLRSANAKAPARLAAYAAEGAAPLELRREAIEVLLLWEKPAGLDRVTGRNTLFAAEGRSHSALTKAVTPVLPALQGDKRLAVEALRLANALGGGTNPSAAGMAMVLDAKLPEATRLAALEEESASLEQHEKEVLDLIRDARQPAALRARAVVLLAEKRPAAAEPVAMELLRNGSNGKAGSPEVFLLQAAYEVAGRSKNPSFDAPLAAQLAAIPNGRPAGPLALDLLEAGSARAAASPELKKALGTLENARAAAAKTVPLAAFDECLDGGDAAKGADIFVQNLNAGCIRCHSNSNVVGAMIGPNLKDVGAKRDRAYLLESLVVPGAKIADGFGLVSLTIKGGGAESGVIVKEDKTTLTLRLPDNSTKAIPAADITARTAPVSIMPPMAGVLTKRELRDVVAYLASLKGP